MLQGRERLFSLGARSLSDMELVALVLGSSGLPHVDPLTHSSALLAALGGLGGLSGASLDQLVGLAGVGEAKAARLKAALELGRRAAARVPTPGTPICNGAIVARWFRTTFAHLRKEHFWVVGLDSKNRLIRVVQVAEGHLSGVEVHPREAFSPLLNMSAARAIFVHNHPSGDPEPSGKDIALTRRLVRAGELLGIPVVDHLVVGREGYQSLMAEQNRFEAKNLER